MPLKPNRREIIVAGASEAWTIRFSFYCPETESHAILVRRGECGKIVRDAMVEIIMCQPTTAEGCEEVVLGVVDRFFEPRLASLEILNGDTGCGMMSYFEPE